MRTVIRIVAVACVDLRSRGPSLAVADDASRRNVRQIMAKLPPVRSWRCPFQPLWMHARAGSIEAGQPAPDFCVESSRRRRRRQLSSFRGKQPVVLVSAATLDRLFAGGSRVNSLYAQI